MAKTESTLVNMLVVLTAITVIAGGALGAIHQVTLKPIADAEATKQENALKAVLPEFDALGEADTIQVEGLDFVVFPATKGGESVGAAVRGVTNSGFAGTVEVMIGFTTEGIVKDYSVLRHAETPGLGSKMGEWFRTDKNKQSILGKPATTNFTVSKDGGDIDAITAATISSRAFLEIVRNAQTAFNEYTQKSTK